MTSDQDHYAVLQVHPEAEPEVIAAAYRSLAQLYHPDRNPSPEAGPRMVQINLAYEVLRDPERRAAYDRRRRVQALEARAYEGDDDEDDEDGELGNEWERHEIPVGVNVVTTGVGWSCCCGVIILVVILVVVVGVCSAAVGLS